MQDTGFPTVMRHVQWDHYPTMSSYFHELVVYLGYRTIMSIHVIHTNTHTHIRKNQSIVLGAFILIVEVLGVMYQATSHSLISGGFAI